MAKASWKPKERRDAPGSGVEIKERKAPTVERPRMYKILLLNDDYTPMEFVVQVLRQFFQMPQAKAVNLMLRIHNEGQGVAGVYTYEIAETKLVQVTSYARRHQHPLRCMLEAE